VPHHPPESPPFSECASPALTAFERKAGANCAARKIPGRKKTRLGLALRCANDGGSRQRLSRPAHSDARDRSLHRNLGFASVLVANLDVEPAEGLRLIATPDARCFIPPPPALPVASGCHNSFRTPLHSWCVFGRIGLGFAFVVFLGRAAAEFSRMPLGRRMGALEGRGIGLR
jgi:hypothetical protein